MCFFSAGFLPAGTELTFKYSGDNDDPAPLPPQQEGEILAQLGAAPTGTNLKIRTGLSVLECKCGAEKCAGLLYRIAGKTSSAAAA